MARNLVKQHLHVIPGCLHYQTDVRFARQHSHTASHVTSFAKRSPYLIQCPRAYVLETLYVAKRFSHAVRDFFRLHNLLHGERQKEREADTIHTSASLEVIPML